MVDRLPGSSRFNLCLNRNLYLLNAKEGFKSN